MAVEELVGPAPYGWKYKTLGAACEDGGGDIQTGPFGSQLHASDYVSVGVPSIMPQNIGDNRIIEDGIARITPEDARRLSRYLVRKGDIVYSRRGDVERRALVRPHEDGWLCGTGCLRVRFGENGADPRYASYYLGHPDVREWIVRHAHGATMPNLNTSILAACPFLEPPPAEQRAIAHILGTLDDKIELNRRMSETLEAMARALFKSWFVDFDPVRAKAEGRDPGLPQPLADLFPDSFEDSELGEIPRGWEVKRLPELIEVNPPRALRKGEVAPYLDMANMPTRGHSPDSVIERSFGSGMRFVNGDTLVARITPCLENGKTAFVDFLAPGQIGWGSTEYIVLRSKPPLPAEFAYCLARSDGFRDFAIQSMTGSSGRQRVPAESLDHYLLTSCPEPIAHAFGSIVASMFARASKASAESRTLAALRDALLPKLISGELRVKDAEKFIGGNT
jgi:type I restriction enzyme S subunit